MSTDSGQLCTILSTRLDNLQLIRREWDMADAKVTDNIHILLLSCFMSQASMESVIALNDQSVLVDMLNHVFCRKQ